VFADNDVGWDCKNTNHFVVVAAVAVVVADTMVERDFVDYNPIVEL
jgi:hypothetical protein